LPTPEATPECESDPEADYTSRHAHDEQADTDSSDVFFDMEDVEDLQQEVPVPVDSQLAPYLRELLGQ
jgi:hypothetical protein